MPATLDATFAPVAQQVARRVALRRGLAWLAGSLRWVTAAVILCTLLALITGQKALAFTAWIVQAVWILAALIHALFRRPGLYSVLSLWDQQAGRREAFASAWWFEQQAELTNAQRAHLDAQRALLPEAQKKMAVDLPLHPHRWLWLPPVLALAGIFVSAAIHPAPEPLTLDEKMVDVAKKEAEKIADTDWQKKNLEGLSEEEKAALEKLKQSLEQTAEELAKAAGKDAREVMSELEKRAREAEKLAERLAADKEMWASDKLVQSLREHADTADLGDAVAAKNAAQTAKAADSLAAQLQSPQITSDVRERLNETLKDNERNADAEDRARTVGQHVLGAAAEMQQSKAVEAGAEFQKLAEKMRDQARREQAQKELEKLAQQLRDAGSNITGQNQAGSMQQMTQAGQSGQRQQPGQSPQVGQAQPQQPGQSGQQQLQPPGLGQMSQQQQRMMQQNPVPGTGQQQRMMMAQQPGQQGQPKGGQPMLFAPIPGQKPGEKPDAFMLGPPGADPGDNPPMAFSMPGGNQAGVGTADLNAQATAQQKAGNQSIVAAQQNNEGSSSVRAVEGGVRKEDSSRSATAVAAEAIAAEEEALDEAALPPSRREQVRRYFTELRKRFEKP